MNFSAALEALRAGKKVRLPEMKDYFVYIATVYNLTTIPWVLQFRDM